MSLSSMYVRNAKFIVTSCRVFDLKIALFSLTNVPPERQKILGLVKGKLPPDEAVMYACCSYRLWHALDEGLSIETI